MSQPSLRVISGVPHLKERLAGLYAARRDGDAEGFAAGFAEDGFMRIMADNRLIPESGPFHGRPAIAKGIRTLFNAYQYVDGLIVDIIADPEAAVIRRQLTLRSRTTGAIADFDVADFIRFRNGEIAELTQYMDTASLAVLAARI
ncbi:MAG: hypothetical protein FD152_953 [Xanthobacteraceae bacterium]|jgi:ketosteroid isomerase-like protein|nr:MAG: hypothetical protein FD152_953 [Xanthobacteraceae bacterium]